MIYNPNDLARYYGVDSTGSDEEIMKRLDRAIYKNTSCGAHIQLKLDGILITSIVEGSEAEYSSFLKFPFSEMAFDDTVELIEDECCAEWHRAAREEDGYED